MKEMPSCYLLDYRESTCRQGTEKGQNTAQEWARARKGPRQKPKAEIENNHK
jgi:hypothetical protein